MLAILGTAGRPDLAEASARLRWEAFFRAKGIAFETILARAEATAREAAPVLPRSFVLLEDGVPLGTASLIANDLEARPELTPWLAGVVVDPSARGRGHGARLVRAVEAAAREAGITTLWLYTHTAEPLYARLGWEVVERFEHGGHLCALMRRILA